LRSPVKVFESHSVTVFVKDELNNSAEEALIKAFSLEWGMAYLRGVGIADGEGKFRFVRKRLCFPCLEWLKETRRAILFLGYTKGTGGLLICWLGNAPICTQKNE